MSRVSILALLVCACGFAPGPLKSGGGAGGSGGAGGAGGSGAGGGGGTIVVEGLPVKMACTVLNAKRCEYLARCGLIEDSDMGRRDCVAWLIDSWCGPTRWPSRVAAGTLLYDGKLAQQCADAFGPARSCDDYDALPSVCNRFTSPNVSPLRACYDGYPECTEGLVCRGAACPRTCQPLGISGDTCQVDTDCRPLLYCKRAVVVTGAGTCTNLGVAGSVCGADEPCGAGLVCAGGKCLQPPSSGSPCAMGNICDDTSWCQFTPDGGACTNKQGAGVSCTDDVQCSAGYLCQQNKCEPKVLGVLPAACSDRQTCPLGTTCVGASAMLLGLCEPPITAGEPCLASDDCQRHLACAPSDGGWSLECAFRQPNRGACTLDRDCQILSRCKGGVCTRLPVTGQSCVEERACLFGPCTGVADGGAYCADRYGPGTQCQLDSDCASNRCVGNMCLPACAP